MAESLGDAVLDLRTNDAAFNTGISRAEGRARQLGGTMDKTRGSSSQLAGEMVRTGRSAQAMGTDFEVSGKQVVQSAGAQRAGMQQLSFQLGDVATMYSLGARPMQIFASQSGQVIQALQLMTNGSKGLIGVLAGPWGIAMTSAVVVLTPFIASLFETEDAASDAEAALADLAESQEDLANFFDMGTGAIKEQNRALVENAILKRQEQADELRAQRATRKDRIREVVREGSEDRLARNLSFGDPRGFKREPGNPALINAARGGDIDANLRAIATSDSDNAERAREILELRALNATDLREIEKIETERQSLIAGKLDPDLRDDGGSSSGRANRSRRSGRSARPGRSQADRDAEFSAQSLSLERETLQAELALATDAQERADIQSDLLSLDRQQRIAEIEATDLSRARKDALIASVEVVMGTAAKIDEQGNMILSANRGIEGEIIAREKAVQAEQEAAALAEEKFSARREALDLDLQLADTEAERKAIALKLLEAEDRFLESRFEAILASEAATAAEKERAEIALNALRSTAGRRREAVSRANETTLERYLRDLQQSPAQINEAIDGIAIDGLDDLNDGLVDAVRGVRSLGDVFSSVADQIIADLLRIAIRQAIVKPLAGALFGGIFGGGGGGPLDLLSQSSLFAGGRAKGGLIPAGQFGIVGEEGPELAFASSSGVDIVSNSQSRMMMSRDSGGESGATNVSIPISIDATGADPAGLERVRAEVEALRRDLPNQIVTTVQEAGDRRIISARKWQ